jgi:hypothetical protein
MTKFLRCLALLFFLQTITYGQISIGFRKEYSFWGEKKYDFTAEELKAIKSTTLVFFYRAADEKLLPELEKALKSVWTATPLKVVPYSQAEKYLNESNYSYASISTLIHGNNSVSSSKRPVWYLLLDFWINKPEEEIPRKSFACVYLSTGSGIPNVSGFGDNASKAGAYYTAGYYGGFQMIDLSYKIKANKELIKEKKIPITNEYFNFLYTNSILLNWNIPDLKAYFSVVNDHVLSGTGRTFCQEESDVSELQKLQKDTLVIPEYALSVPYRTKRDLTSYKQATKKQTIIVYSRDLDSTIYKQASEKQLSKVLSAYPYPYKILSQEELTKKIQDSSKPTYYLSHIVNNAKIIAIINSKTGKVIYTKCIIILSNQGLVQNNMTMLKKVISNDYK